MKSCGSAVRPWAASTWTSSSLGRTPSNAARSERTFPHGGVAGHPGDKGMKALADALLRAMTRQP